MGMTLTVLNNIQSLSMSWMSTKIPVFSNLISLKEYTSLDIIFEKTLKQSAIINALALFVVFAVIYVIRDYKVIIHGMNIGERFLDYLPLFLMMSSILLNQFVFSWATYLRCHKEEPYLLLSIVTGIACLLSTILFGKYFGVIGITLGYSSITLGTFIWAYILFLKKRQQWHTNPIG
jgi:hypothetical protein